MAPRGHARSFSDLRPCLRNPSEGAPWHALRLGLFIAGVAMCGNVGAAETTPPIPGLKSPNGLLRLTIGQPSASGTKATHWSLAIRKHAALFTGRLGLHLAPGGDLFAGAEVRSVSRRTVDERVPMLFGKAAHADNRYEELRLGFATADRRPVEVVFRCYDDALAFRYEFASNAVDAPVVVQDETTSFRVAGDPVARVQFLEHHRTSHEHEVQTLPASGIRPGALLDLPLAFEWPDGTYAALTEAALRGYAGMALTRTPVEGGPDEWVCRLTPRADGTKVVRTGAFHTPWRVVMVGERAGALLESTTLYALNEPPASGDWSWIKPGKITFHWWNGDVFDGRPGDPILSYEMAVRYIDFCARHGITAHSLTSTEGTTTPWYQQSKPGVEPGPDTDVTRPRPGFELERIRRYAESKGVRLWTWVHQAALRGRVGEAFAAFERMGWSGMMVDFFDHDDQDTVDHVEAILAAAARHRILIHLHGIWKPTGLERTYPNLMNHEGALNLEYLKWSDRCTPDHDVNMAFTRLIAGPMDYHLGGFRAVPRDAFEPRNVAPLVLGTRAHMLAMYVCFDNPTPMLADFPTAYEGQAGFDFLKQVPTWWDETRVVAAHAGEYLVTARRRGAEWYLGGLSANHARTIEVPLRFLPTGRFQLQVWLDAAPVAGATIPDPDPNAVVTERRLVQGRETLRLAVARHGGFAAHLSPERR